MTAIALTILLWGLAGILAGRASRNAHALSLLVWGPIVAFPIAGLLLALGADTAPAWQFLLLASISSLFVFCAWGLYLLALQRGPTSSVVAIGSVYPLFALFMLWLLGDPPPGLWAIGGVALIALGLFWFQSRDVGWKSSSVFFLSLSAALLWSLWSVGDYLALQHGSALDLVFWNLLFSAIYGALLGIYLKLRSSLPPLSRTGILYRLASGAASLTAIFFFYQALSGSWAPAVVISLTSIYPLVTMLLAVLLREEKIEAHRLIALLLVVLGVVALYL